MAHSEYLVLRQHPADGHWEAIPGNVIAGSSNQAVKAVAVATAPEGETVNEGTYVAVPNRSWKPVHVHYEQKPVVVLREKKAKSAAAV